MDKKEYLKQYRLKNKEKIKELNKKWRNNNIEKIKELNQKWQEEHKEEIAIYQKDYRQDHKKESKDYRREYDNKNRKKVSERNKKYRIENKEKLNEWRKKYYHDKLKNNVNHKIKSNLRRRLNALMLGKEKHKKTLDLLGISVEEFRKYIELKWVAGMSWDNYGINGWHIDHITPLSHFNLQNPIELEKAAHYTNMQPMWESDNCSKGNRFVG